MIIKRALNYLNNTESGFFEIIEKYYNFNNYSVQCANFTI